MSRLAQQKAGIEKGLNLSKLPKPHMPKAAPGGSKAASQKTVQHKYK